MVWHSENLNTSKKLFWGIKLGETSLKNWIGLLGNLATLKRPFLAAKRGETSLKNAANLMCGHRLPYPVCQP